MRLSALFAAIFWVAFFCVAAVVRGATYIAASPSESDVQAAVNLANDGDTVIVPAGSATWSNTLSIANPNRSSITLEGAGTNATFITDELSNVLRSANKALIGASPDTNAEFRLTGFTFLGGTVNTVSDDNGLIRISGNCWQVRIDHLACTNLHGTQIAINGWDYGVIDHCSFIDNFKIGVLVWMPTYGNLNNANGDYSWSDDERLGSTNAIFIEDNYFNDTSPSASSANALDAYFGARVVFRHNYCFNTGPSTHGTESSGRARGFRTLEVYNNTCVGTNGGGVSAGIFRGGTGVVFSNTYTGTFFSGQMRAANYRDSTSFTYWGVASGVNGWDSNDPTLYTSGTCTSISGGPLTMTDNSAAWTTNQWVGYTLGDTNTVRAAVIFTNDSRTITFEDGSSITGSGYLKFTAGDSYEIRKPLIDLDQPGRGKGDLLLGLPPTNSVLGGVTWPREALEPIYSWSNTVNGVLAAFSGGSPPVQANRDYYNDTPMPGYTPYTYPHPLDNPVTLAYFGFAPIMPLH